MDYKETEIVSKLEGSYWWHQFLFRMEAENINQNLNSKNINVLDAACGSGGLLKFLRNKGYTNISGFDLSEKAVNLAKNSGLNVNVGDLRDISKFRDENTFDVITCNDALYFLADNEKIHFLNDVGRLLINNGLLIINLPAFNVLGGTHNKIAQIENRFTKRDISTLIKDSEFEIVAIRYWPFFLSPIILFVRLFQKMKTKVFNVGTGLESDVKKLPKVINSILYYICLIESRICKKPPFGSSLFVVLRKKSQYAKPDNISL